MEKLQFEHNYIESVNVQYRNRITWSFWLMAILVAGLELIQWSTALLLFVLGVQFLIVFMNFFISLLCYLIIIPWKFIHNITIFENVKKIVVMFFIPMLDFLPFLSWLPFFSLTLLLLYFIIKYEDRRFNRALQGFVSTLNIDATDLSPQDRDELQQIIRNKYIELQRQEAARRQRLLTIASVVAARKRRGLTVQARKERALYEQTQQDAREQAQKIYDKAQGILYTPNARPQQAL